MAARQPTIPSRSSRPALAAEARHERRSRDLVGFQGRSRVPSYTRATTVGGGFKSPLAGHSSPARGRGQQARSASGEAASVLQRLEELDDLLGPALEHRRDLELRAQVLELL